MRRPPVNLESLGFFRSPSGRRAAERRRSFEARCRLEVLEERTLLSTDVWTGVNSSSWSDGGNWSLGTPPATSDVAEFTKSGSGTSLLAATVDGSTTIAGLLIDGTWNGTLTLEAPLTLTGTSQFSNGTIDFSEDTSGSVPVLGSLSNSGTLTISGSNLLQWNAADTISNSGTLDLSASSTFVLSNGATLDNSGMIADQIGGSDFRLDAGILNNEPGGTFDFQADSTFIFSSAGTFNNFGRLRKSAGTGDSAINVDFENQNGTIEVDEGTISLPTAGGTSSGGNFIVASGAVLDLTGGQTVAYAGSYHGSGAGTVLLESGTLAVGAGGATFNFAAGLFQWSGGTIDTSLGNLTNDGTMTLSGAGGGSEHLRGTGILTNLGMIDQTGAATFDLDSPAALENVSIGTYDLAADSGISEDQLGGTFVNAGTLAKTSGTGTSAIDGGINFNDTGTVEAKTGTLSIANAGQVISGGTLSGGTWVVDAGSALALAGHVTNLGATVDLNGPGASFPALSSLTKIAAPGELNITSGGSFATTGNLDNAGTLELGPGTVNVTGNYTQEPGGALDVGIRGTGPGTQFGQLTVHSQATLAGTLDLSSGGGFTPTLSQTFAIIPAGTVSGTFANVTGAALSGPVSFQASYGTNSVSLVTVKSSTPTVTSSSNPSAAGESITFTATVQAVSPETGTPTGSVTFMDGSTTLGSATLSGGSATYSTSSLSLGRHVITVDYGGDSNFVAGISTTLDQQVLNGTNTAVTGSTTNNTASFGQQVTFTATVQSVVSGGGTPTGSVTFNDGSTTLGTGTLSGGSAQFSTSSLALGNRVITVAYGGDTNFATSTSKTLTQTVIEDGTTAAVTSSTSKNTSAFGQQVIFTATVQAAAPGSGTPTGSVTFKDGSTTLGSAKLSGGSTTFPISTLPVGSDSITAVYDGDTDFSTSPSPAVTQTVTQDGTNTAVTSSTYPNPSVFGQTVTFHVTVTPADPGSGTLPTGSVAIMAGSTTLGFATLSGGSATFPTSALPLGTDSITAVYGGDPNFATSPSQPVNQSVNQDGTKSAVTSSGTPSAYGAPVTFKATVSASSPGSGTPTGSVTFMDGSTSLGSAVLAGGSAILTSSTLVGGPHSITVVYSGDPNFTISTSPVFGETIGQVGSKTSVVSSINRSVYGQLVTLTARVTPGSGLGTPTGSVTFMDGSSTLGTAMLSGGSAVLTTNLLTLASHAISAVYAGNSSFTTSTSPGFTQTVIQAGTFTVLTPSSNPGFTGQPVTITVAVISASPGIAAPAGSVIFKEGKKTLGRATLINGSAKLTIKKLALGANKIQVVYSGNADFKGNSSPILKEVIKKKPPTKKKK
ncbi:MAG: beta strand repeat-containing protein [Isosphaerales bacterium]